MTGWTSAVTIRSASALVTDPMPPESRAGPATPVAGAPDPEPAAVPVVSAPAGLVVGVLGPVIVTGWAEPTDRAVLVDLAVEARKLERNVKILRRELEERPDDPFVLFNLGASAVERSEWHDALGFLGRSLSGSAPTDSIVRKLYALIARVHQMMGNSQEALRTCALGLKLDPEDAELWFREAVVHRHRGEAAEAERCWRRILDLKRPDQFCSFDQGIYGHITRRNLAALAAERGDHVEVERLWNDVLTECPGDREAQAKLGYLQMETAACREK